ncbi:MAG TPA: aminoglycoside phosphotransferase family protein [Actinospica sp.]|jgi:aminoglycoside phosphotransferase (APT) family kinase protein|nr:aminoglycoside phosphotransferase family protein [Actinospica sp.]
MDVIDIDDDLVLALLRDQRPDLADLPLRHVGRGWANELWRLGDDLAVRVARTEDAPEWLRKEHLVLPRIAARLPLPVPTPLFLAEPSALYPQPWSVVEWVSGDPADGAEIEKPESAVALAGFLRALHAEEPPPSRRDGGMRGRIRSASCELSDDLVEYIGDHQARGLRDIWREAQRAPEWSGPGVFVHNDLHPANVVTKDGALAGVIDFGAMSAGDPAIDLAAAWTLLPGALISTFFDSYAGVDAATRCRARGWAVQIGTFVVQMALNGLRGLPGGKPHWLPVGRKSLDRILAVC